MKFKQEIHDNIHCYPMNYVAGEKGREHRAGKILNNGENFEDYTQNYIKNYLIEQWNETDRHAFVDRLKLNNTIKLVKYVNKSHYERIKLVIEIEMTDSEHIMYQLLPDIIDVG